MIVAFINFTENKEKRNFVPLEKNDCLVRETRHGIMNSRSLGASVEINKNRKWNVAISGFRPGVAGPFFDRNDSCRFSPGANSAMSPWIACREK